MPVSEVRTPLIGRRKALTMSEQERHEGNHACLKENSCTLLWGLFAQDAPQGHTLSESALVNSLQFCMEKIQGLVLSTLLLFCR